jgi:hypothetical protein
MHALVAEDERPISASWTTGRSRRRRTAPAVHHAAHPHDEADSAAVTPTPQ